MTTATIDAATTEAKAIDTQKTALESVTAKPEQDTQGRDVSIPLDKLFLSPNNVRKTRNKQSIPELAALIESQGILQRLLITDAGDGRFAVEAGGRRLEACQYLAGKGAPMPPTNRSTAACSRRAARWRSRWPRTRGARRCTRPISSSPFPSS